MNSITYRDGVIYLTVAHFTLAEFKVGTVAEIDAKIKIEVIGMTKFYG